ncbi:Ubiquitin carboxyl-terminal hydrolase 38 [Amphibalanus amphitrite]|uniref:Ubiquitin carboxyl-terminal hydrolase 38 n=1 Tax=Amphibalanus amphitrite TaxID=1232801 RepID=A0A6A4WFY0_AMPAM|nr:Ubiquitin carboxyl-terminal hydrolase 38 [Amphibalanus amphitrite]
MLKHPAAPKDELLPPPPAPSDPGPLTVTPEEVEAAINSMPPGSSAGLDGIRPLHLRQLISREAAESGRRLLHSLTVLTNLVLAGEVPDCARDALFSASLCALRKKSGGLRPIAVGSVYRRLPSRIGARFVADSLGAELRPVQLGVGTPLGCEAAVHATRSFIEASRQSAAPHVLVKLDVSNAFNTVRRDVFLTRIRERCPEVYYLAYQAYSSPSPLIIGGQTIASACGVQQGDPLGPAAFAIAIDSCARAVSAPLNIWYLDDATLAGPASAVAADIATLPTALAAAGLSLNASKCEVAFIGAEDSDHRHAAIGAICSALPDVKETELTNLSLLGSPLTDGSIGAAGEAASAMVQRLCTRLRELDSHTAVFFLAHHVSAPRLTYLLRSAPAFKAPHVLQATDEMVRSTLEAVCNVAINPAAWEQASLPVKFGGLGIRSVEALALPAYIASVNAARPLIRSICPSVTDELSDTLETAVSAFLHRTGVDRQQLPDGELVSSQRAWDTVACTVVQSRLLVPANQIDRARLIAAGQPHTAAWIQAVPVPSLGLHLDDETVRVAVALRLGAPVCEPHRCRLCARPVTPLGHHGLSCQKSAGRHSRHAHLNDVVRRALSGAGFPAILEPVGLDRGDGRRPDGITVFPFREGKCLTWDATCVDTFADHIAVESALKPGAAARQAEERKRQRYADLARRYSFVPVALETTGVYGPAAAAFVQDLGRRLATCTGERRETEWLRQRLSVAIARGNAASVLATAPQSGIEQAGQTRRAASTAGSNPGTTRRWPRSHAVTAATPSASCAPEVETSGKRSTRATPPKADSPTEINLGNSCYRRGLVNLGNTCFMNTVLQALFHSDQLRGEVLAARPSPSRPHLAALQRVFAFLAFSERPVYSPGEFQRTALPPCFERGRQHDCSEFLRCFLDALHEEERSPAASPAAPVAVPPPVPPAAAAARTRDDSSVPGAAAMERPRSRRRHRSCDTARAGGRSPPVQLSDLASDDVVMAEPAGDRAERTAAEGEPTESPDTGGTQQTDPDGQAQGEVVREHGTGDAGAEEPPAGLVRRLLTGRAETTFTCLTCGGASRHENSVTDLHLALPESVTRSLTAAAAGAGGAETAPAFGPAPRPVGWRGTPPTDNQTEIELTVSQLLLDYLTPERLCGDNQYYCTKCTGLRDAERQLRLLSPPANLVVSLMRFAVDRRTGARRKVLTPVELTEWLTVPLATGPPAQYRLYAVIVHVGHSLDAGHYFSFCRASGGGGIDGMDDTGWWRLDDTSAVPVPAATALGRPRRSTEAAYTLLYRLTDAAVAGAAGGLSALAALPGPLRAAVERDNAVFRRERQSRTAGALPMVHDGRPPPGAGYGGDSGPGVPRMRQPTTRRSGPSRRTATTASTARRRP